MASTDPKEWRGAAGLAAGLGRLARGAGLTAGLTLLVATAAGAQQPTRVGSITGRVVNAATEGPVASAQIYVVGTGLGAVSGAGGEFVISNVPAGTHQVRAEIIGFAAETQPVTVQEGAAATVTFRLRTSAVLLDQVVVTGVGAAARRKEIGNSLAQIDVAKLSTKPVENLESLLRGSTAGVQSLSISGQVGSSGTLQLRGVNSVSQGNAPLIYVDGVRLSTARIPPANLQDGRGPRVSGMALDELNLGDIERVEVIKGAAATTLYGTEASGGVIQIFTKKGASGKPQWAFAVTGGANFWPTLSKTICEDPSCLDLNPIKRTGPVQRFEGSVRGGNENLRYYISGSGSSDKGIVDTQWSKHYGVTGNFDVTLSPTLHLSLNNSYTNRQTRYVADSNNRHGYILNAMRQDKGYWPGQRDHSWVLQQELLGETDNFISGLNLEHVWSSHLRNNLRFGLNTMDATNSGVLPFGYYLYTPGSIGVQRWQDRTLTAEYTGTWETALTSSLRSSLTWGGQYISERRHEVDASGLDFSGPGNFTISSAARTTSSEDKSRKDNAGVFLQEKLGIADRLFLIGGVRVDGNSAFGKDYGLQTYPKVSASYVISDEAFWPQELIPSLRLRAAVGEAGKAPGAFDAVRTWDPIAGLKGQPGVTTRNLGNPELGPERTREIELGFDAALLASRLSIEATYYDATTQNALFQVQPIPSQGFNVSQVRNVGELKSHGLELTTNLTVLPGTRLGWAVGANLTTNHGEVSDMGGAAPISFGYKTEVREGYAPPSFFGRKVTNPDALADPVFEDGQYLGNTLPTMILGVHTDIQLLNNVTLSALGELNKGGHVLNETAYLNSLRNLWPACTAIQAQAATPSGLAQLTAAQRAKCLSKFTGEDQWIESGDFFKLRNISASYKLPEGLLPRAIESATLTVSGTNLIKITDFTGLDPEVNDGGSTGTEQFRRVDYYNFPPRRAILAKLNVTF
ncbi:MAG TPA: TonB-dependent receptor [Longimicrobiales bacterium]|nr:TonB-dependent receptor [Longimicrobiales bacterium]